MKAFKIKDTRAFMSLLLTTSCFDTFLLEQAHITTFNEFSIDGRIRKEFYGSLSETAEESFYEFSLWKDLRPVCFQLIKGKRTPLHFKTVFLLMDNLLPVLPAGTDLNGIKAFTLLIQFDGAGITLVTGVSTHTFVMDRTAELFWDDYLPQFLLKNKIDWEPI